MKRGSAIAILLALALLGCALAAARLVAHAGARGVELGRARVTSVDPALAERLARGDVDLLVQWFGPATGARPAGYDDVEAQVRAAFRALERAAPGRVRTQVLAPDSDPEARRHAEALGLVPFRARRIVRDGWEDVPVWSALRTVVAGSGASVVGAVTPELAGSVQSLIAAGVAEVEAPRAPRIALSAPPGHARLRELLRTLGSVSEVDFDVDASVPEDADLLVWIVAGEGGARQAGRLRAFVERGGSAIVAASPFRARVDGTQLAFDTGPALPRALLADLGVEADDGVLLDAPPPEAQGSARDWTWHVARSIGARQDFRALAAQPNGTLAFAAPAALRPDLARLRETAASFTSLATSSERAFTLDAGTTRVALDALAAGNVGAAEPPRTLLALVAPEDPTRGSVVLAASASPFGDLGLADANSVHEELVRVLVRGLASSGRRVLTAAARARPAPLPEATGAQRWTARALCIALVPLVLIVVGAARGAFAFQALGGRAPRLALLALAGAAAAALAARAIGANAGVDLTRGDEHGLAPELVAIARSAADAGGGVTLTLAFSGDSALPSDLRPPARDLFDLCARLARAVPAIEVRELAADALEDGPLRARGLRRLARASATDETRSSHAFHASLVVESGGRTRVLEFPDAASFEHAAFRLSLALRATGSASPARVAFASEPARVTPAEAHTLYTQRGLFAPGTGDPFAAARALLAASGFEVASVDPSRADTTELDANTLLVWMQPRRDASSGVRLLARHLAAGGRALVAAQQHRIRPRQRADHAAESGLWPEPLFPHVDALWLPAIGVRLAPELLLDAQSGLVRVAGTRERDGRVEAVAMDLAGPLVVRSTPASRPATAFTAGVGDVLLPSPSRVELDAVRLARHGLAATRVLATSDRAWTVAWSGGDVPATALDVPADAGGPLVLGALIEGRFPGPDADPALGANATTPATREGRLLVLGASEPFTDALLASATADHARFVLQSCAALALPAEHAALLARRPSVGGYRMLAPRERLQARAIALAAGPALVLLLALSWRTWRARRSVRGAAA